MMSTKNAPSLSTLPVELIYRILDYLDIETSLLSFRYVSKKFYFISNKWNSYNYDLSSISKNHFDLICRQICQKKIVSITLSDEDTTPGQIRLFFSLNRISNFPRLRSLTLRNIDSNDLYEIVKDILNCSLTTFSCQSRGKQNKSIIHLLSKLIIQSNLEILSLNTHAHYIEQMFKSMTQSHLIELTIGILTFNEYQTILQYCPYLRVFVIDDCWINDTDQNSTIKSYQQLISLTLKFTNRSITQLEYLLLLTPSLTELKLINSPLTPNSLINGSYWEVFIKTKLLSLIKFQFVFYQLVLRTYECNGDVELFIIPFRTSFWLEEKQWFVNCQSIKSSHTIQLYSVPFSINSYDYNFDLGNILLSTSIKKLNHSIIMDHVRCLSLNLTEIKTKQILKKNIKRDDFLFSKVTELNISVHGEWPIDSFYFISILVDLLKLQKLSFRSDFDQSTIDNLTVLVNQAFNIHSLSLLPLNMDGQYNTTVTNLCSIVSLHVKHLTIKIEKLDDMKIVVKKLKHLLSISFNFPSDRKINSHEMIDWLINNGQNFTYLEYEYFLHFWFGLQTFT
ncbi:unnamed protein product [Adineta steineri]|uniref:F-box domain-containing protein n=1 Tax=Adineta steineri TaxID=433720 RepID=A0A813U0R7_9BILA|nr:unnamed protein product [Adineta steineri]CAF3876907.1 unnamed protein product [Adineta steineri]